MPLQIPDTSQKSNRKIILARCLNNISKNKRDKKHKFAFLELDAEIYVLVIWGSEFYRNLCSLNANLKVLYFTRKKVTNFQVWIT